MTKLGLLTWSWQSKLVGSIAIVGTLFSATQGDGLAQVVPDSTLGAESSSVTPDVVIQGIPSDQIDGGAIRGANLFHSFAQLSVLAGRGAYFTNPTGIANILARVTGTNRSEILGRLGVLGNANLLLINPNGIVFGPNASLDVQGSFLATTADAVKLGDTGLFSATEPATSNLLAVNPSALLFHAIAAQPIVNRSRAASTIGQPNSQNGSPGLQVQPGRTLALVGGDVLLEGGNLMAAGGRIELGSVAGVGQVNLSQTGNRFVLGYDSIDGFGSISLSNRSVVDASGEGGGDVQIRGARLEVKQDSDIWADTLGAQNGGEVIVHTTEEVVLSESSLLTANVTRTGTGGDLTIDTGRLLVRDGAQVSAGNFGEGKGGSLLVRASELVEVIGRSADGRSSSTLFAQNQGSGDGGDLRIDTGRLLVRDGARVSAANFGAGKGGSLLVKASESVEVIGGISADLQSGALLDTENYGSGDGGDLRIDTGRLLVRVGQVTTGTFGAGKGGNLLVKASESAEVIGVFANGLLPSGLFTNSEAYTFINGNIDSEPILRNGSSNNQIPNGGDAGNLIIDTRRLIVRDGALVGSPTFTSGKGGTLQITASDSIELSGNSPIGQPSVLFSRSRGVDSSGNPLIANGGDAGNIIINTGRLILRDGAAVDTTTETLGQGGILQITASDSIELIGTSFDGLLPSGLFTDTRNLYPNNPDSPQVSNGGNAGNLTINTKRLIVRDGAQVSSGTATSGNGGTLRITASDLIELSGTSPDSRLPSGLSTRSGMILSNNSILLGTGTAGNLIIDTGNLLLRDGAELSTNSLGEGLAGDITITVRDTLQANNGTIRTDSAQSRGGSITITAGDIRLFGDSDIRSNVASGAGGGGNIYLKAGSIVALDDSDILAFARDGRGGNITLNTPAFFGQNYRPAPRNTNPDTLDHNDRVDVNASGAVSGIITTPDTSFIQNSLTELPSNQINTDSLLANSCIVRRNQPSKGTFFITGTGGLPQRPGDTQLSTFPMVDITTLPQDSTFSPTDRNRPWQKGDPIVEPQGMYRLPNGKLVLSRECSE